MLDRRRFVPILVALLALALAAPATAAPPPDKSSFVLRKGRVPKGTPLLTERIKQLDDRLDKSGVQNLLLEANRHSGRRAGCVSAAWPQGLPSDWFCLTPDDTLTREWWPQGVTGISDAQDDERWGARQALVVSEYDACSTGAREDHAGCPDPLPKTVAPEKGVRLLFLDPDRSFYRHVLLVYPYTRKPDRKPSFHGVGAEPGGGGIHGGGIVWYGNYLYVADTHRGVRVFDLRNIFDLGRSSRGTTRDRTKIGLHGQTYHAFGYRYVLPQAGSWVNDRKRQGDCRGQGPPVFSYLSVDRSQVPDVMVSGEYCTNMNGRMATWPLRGGATDPNRGQLAAGSDGRVRARHTAKLPDHNIQGATGANGTWWFTRSRGSARPGLLIQAVWNGGGSWHNVSSTPTAIGPEDLYCWRGRRQVWSVSEHPGKRVIYAHDRATCGA